MGFAFYFQERTHFSSLAEPAADQDNDRSTRIEDSLQFAAGNFSKLKKSGERKTMPKILLVDDENLILYSLSRTLTHEGAKVTAVTSGTDALREIRQCPYDICFLDVHLPDANGLDLMKTIREVSPHTAIIIMTAVYLDDQRLQGLRSQGCHYLPKPFDLGHVTALVDELSGKKQIAADTP